MAVFAIVSVDPRAELETALKANYGTDHLRWGGQNVWLLHTTDSALQICEKLGLMPGQASGGIMVLGLSGDYWGLTSTATWDWLKTAFLKDGRGS